MTNKAILRIPENGTPYHKSTKRRLPAWIWTQAWEYAQPDLYEDEKVPCTEGGMLNLVLFTIYGPVMVQSIDFDFVTETSTNIISSPANLISQPS